MTTSRVGKGLKGLWQKEGQREESIGEGKGTRSSCGRRGSAGVGRAPEAEASLPILPPGLSCGILSSEEAK